jgi:predicted amidophosphoribosyltransferase
VLVVDDVATTGATLSAITRCLLEINATVVYAAVLARTDETISHEGDR